MFIFLWKIGYNKFKSSKNALNLRPPCRKNGAYYDGNVSICGIYNYDSAYNSYLVHNDVFNKMLDDYGNTYVYDRSLIYISEELYDNVISYIDREDTVVLEPSINGIYEFENLMKSFLQIHR